MSRVPGEDGPPPSPGPSPHHPAVLVIFDIDGTLAPVTSAGSRALRTAARECFGRDGDLAGLPLAGRTDAAIFGDYAERLGLPRDAWRAPALQRAYARQVAVELEADWAPLPGVARLVAALAADGRFALAVGTGNLACAAEIKLRRLALDDTLAVGAFGEDSEERSGMVRAAHRRAEARCGVALPASRAVVVGDAIGDVEAAHRNGMRALAVGTGPAGARVAAARPDLYVPDLRGTRNLVHWLGA